MVRDLITEDRAWPRYETIYGELHVTPAPRWSHQLVVGRVHVELASYLTRERVGVVLVSPADISWGRDDVLVQPDVFVVPIDEARTVHRENAWPFVRDLILAVEVLSPSSSRYDRFTKRALYQRMGVPSHWVVDGERGEMEAWTPEHHFPEVERERLIWHPDGAEAPLTLDIPALFAPP